MSDTLVHTLRLDLSPLHAEAVEAMLAGEGERLHRLTGARFRTPGPPPYMAEALPVVRDRLRERPEEAHWWNWLVVERGTGDAVGSVAAHALFGVDGSGPLDGGLEDRKVLLNRPRRPDVGPFEFHGGKISNRVS